MRFINRLFTGCTSQRSFACTPLNGFVQIILSRTNSSI